MGTVFLKRFISRFVCTLLIDQLRRCLFIFRKKEGFSFWETRCVPTLPFYFQNLRTEQGLKALNHATFINQANPAREFLAAAEIGHKSVQESARCSYLSEIDSQVLTLIRGDWSLRFDGNGETSVNLHPTQLSEDASVIIDITSKQAYIST